MPGFSTQISDNCIIHLPEENLDDETRILAEKMANTEVFNHIRIMPDCHTGSNCCVGMTTEIHDKVIPQIVGGDIGCGISCYSLGIEISEKKVELRNIYDAPKEILTLERFGRWTVVQLVKAFFGMPVIPGK